MLDVFLRFSCPGKCLVLFRPTVSSMYPRVEMPDVFM